MSSVGVTLNVFYKFCANADSDSTACREWQIKFAKTISYDVALSSAEDTRVLWAEPGTIFKHKSA